MSDDVTLDDTSTQIGYAPENAWQLDQTLGSYQPYNGTVHSTTQVNATASLVFTGTSISVNCLLLPTGSNFTATLDNTLVGTYNTEVPTFSTAASKTMFTKSGLDGNSQHTLVLQKIANDPGWVSSVTGDEASHLNIDSFTIVGGSAAGSTTTSPASTSTSSSSLPAGAIAGISIGAIALILIVAAFFWYRRRNTRRSTAIGHTPFVDPTPQPSEAKGHQYDSSAPVSTASPAPQPRAPTAPGEKVRLPFANQNEGPGSNSRNGWRSSLFELPGRRVVRAQSRMPPPGTALSEGESDIARSTGAGDPDPNGAHNAIRFAPPPPTSVNPNTHPQLTESRVQRHDRDSIAVPETTFSALESHITESTVPPSTVPESRPHIPEASTSSPSSSPRTQNIQDREKTSFQGPHSGTATSLPLSASTIPPPSTSPPSGTSDVNTHVLLRELAGLRDQVRHLTELHHGGGGVYTAGEAVPHEPPPEYVGRDSDEESEA